MKRNKDDLHDEIFENDEDKINILLLQKMKLTIRNVSLSYRKKRIEMTKKNKIDVYVFLDYLNKYASRKITKQFSSIFIHRITT